MLVLLTAVLLTSCGGAPASTGPRLGLELDGQGDAPTAALIVADERHEGVLGTYCWEFPGGDQCTDTFGLRVPSSYVEVERGTLLSVEGDFQRLHGRLGAPRPLTEEDVGAPGFVELRHPVELDLFDEEASLTSIRAATS